MLGDHVHVTSMTIHYAHTFIIYTLHSYYSSVKHPYLQKGMTNDVLTVCSLMADLSEGKLRSFVLVLIHIETLSSNIQVFSTRSGPTNCFFVVRPGTSRQLQLTRSNQVTGISQGWGSHAFVAFWFRGCWAPSKLKVALSTFVLFGPPRELKEGRSFLF